MQRKKIIVGMVLSGMLAVSALALVGCGSTDGASVYNKKCSVCHGLDTVTNSAYSGEADWTSVVDSMVNDQGASLTEDEQAAVVEYLVSTD